MFKRKKTNHTVPGRVGSEQVDLLKQSQFGRGVPGAPRTHQRRCAAHGRGSRVGDRGPAPRAHETPLRALWSQYLPRKAVDEGGEEPRQKTAEFHQERFDALEDLLGEVERVFPGECHTAKASGV